MRVCVLLARRYRVGAWSCAASVRVRLCGLCGLCVRYLSVYSGAKNFSEAARDARTVTELNSKFVKVCVCVCVRACVYVCACVFVRAYAHVSVCLF